MIADEAHRGQYGFRSRMIAGEGGGWLVAGFAQHMRDALPGASFIGFTGTPVDAKQGGDGRVSRLDRAYLR